MCLRIPRSRATVKELHRRLQDASWRDDLRLVRRTTVWLARLVPHVPVRVLCERWGLSPACLHAWQQAFLLPGMDSLVYGLLPGMDQIPSISYETKTPLYRPGREKAP